MGMSTSWFDHPQESEYCVGMISLSFRFWPGIHPFAVGFVQHVFTVEPIRNVLWD